MAASDSTTKRCTKCGEEKPATLEYFPPDKRLKSGLLSYCRQCRQLVAREINQRPENIQKKRERDRSPQSKAKEKQRRQKPEYKEKRKRRKQSPEGKAKLLAYNVVYYQTPGFKIRRKVNKDKRRAFEVGADGRYTAADIEELLRSQRYRCWWCGCKITDEYHVDHRVALSRGGTNWPNNLCISCVHCNTSKCNKLPHEWSDRLL